MDASTLLKMFRNTAVYMAVSVAVSFHVQAQTSGSLLYSADDEAQTQMRENPEIDTAGSLDDDDNIIVPSYVNDRMAITTNGADWSKLRMKLKNGKSVNVVHIGDSHLQADIATQVTRELLQFDYGNGGRGLVTPLRLSGTNEPWNYSFKSDLDWEVERFMKYPWGDMGFTGCAITSRRPQGYVEVATSDRNDWNPFNSVTFYHSGEMKVEGVEDENGNELRFQESVNGYSTTLHLAKNVRLARVKLNGNEPLTLYGAYLAAGKPGLVYNVIGHNGATYQTYNRINGFGSNLSELSPDLVVISLGCNEAFGSFNDLAFLDQVDKLVKSIIEHNKDAAILLTTPMECQRRVTTYGKRSKKSRRRVAHTSFAVNTKVQNVRAALLRYAKQKGIAIYDFYNVAGGDGASAKWINDGLYSKDRVHLSGKGYHLQGKLFYDALSKELEIKK